MTRSARPAVRGLARLVAIIPVLGGLAGAATVTKIGPEVLGCAQAATAHHAALVVEHGDGAVITVCVAFSEDSVTGEQLLNDARAQTQLEYATTGYGGGNGDAVCQIDNEPGQYPPGCWSASSPYWALFVSRGGGTWAESGLGVSSQTFHDGDAEGFRYEGQSDNSPPPAPQGVCPPPSTAVPTPVPARTATASARRAAASSAPAPRSPTPAGTADSSVTPATPSASLIPPGVGGDAGGARGQATIASSAAIASNRIASWAATALGAALLAGLLAMLARSRRRPGRPPP